MAHRSKYGLTLVFRVVHARLCTDLQHNIKLRLVFAIEVDRAGLSARFHVHKEILIAHASVFAAVVNVNAESIEIDLAIDHGAKVLQCLLELRVFLHVLRGSLRTFRASGQLAR